MKVSIFIPAYNEARNLPLLLPLVEKTIEENNLDAEILLVNDGSTDSTQFVAEKLAKKSKYLKVITHKTNKGLTKAFMTCFKEAKGDIIVFIPADLQSNPLEDIPKLLSKIDEGYDLVVGWRQNRKGSKKLASDLYNLISRKLFKLNLHDLNWIKAFKKDIIRDMDLRSDWHRYIPIIAHSNDYKIGEVKVNVFKRKYGKSKFGVSRLLIGTLDLIFLKFHTSFFERPMLVFGSTGILSIALGFIGGVYLLLTKIFTGVIGNRPLIFLVLLLIVLGIQLFALGFLAEYLVTIKNEIRK